MDISSAPQLEVRNLVVSYKLYQEAQLPQRKRASNIALSYGAKRHFDMLNRLKSCASTIVNTEISFNMKWFRDASPLKEWINNVSITLLNWIAVDVELQVISFCNVTSGVHVKALTLRQRPLPSPRVLAQAYIMSCNSIFIGHNLRVRNVSKYHNYGSLLYCIVTVLRYK